MTNKAKRMQEKNNVWIDNDKLSAWIDDDENSNLINKDKDLKDSGIEELNYEIFKLNAEKTFQIIQSASEIILPFKNNQVRFITFKSFNMALLLSHIAKLEKIKEMYICAYSINHLSAEIINEIVRQHDCKTEILISNLRNQAYRKKEEMTKEIFIKNKNIKLFFCSSHAKIISIKTENNYYHIEGSGNLSFNSRIEQMVIDNDIKLFEFTKGWFIKVREFLKDKKELVSFNYQ